MQPSIWTAPLLACFFFIPIGLLTTGCEEDLGLREDYPEPFTLYGLLSPDLDTQSVRVYPLQDIPGLALPQPHGITFTSTDLTTNDVLVWNDSIVVAEDGREELVFWLPFRVDYDKSYRVTAIRDVDQVSSYAEVRIPPEVSIRIEQSFGERINDVEIEIEVLGANTHLLVPEIEYAVFSDNGGGTGRVVSILRTYHGFECPSEAGWKLGFNFYNERNWVQSLYNIATGSMLGIRCDVLALRHMEMQRS